MRIKSVLAALALSPLAVSAVHADQLSDVMSKKSLSCGVYADVPPFSAPDPQTRELVGMDVDLCKALAKHMGVELELKPLSVEARIPEVKMGRVDVIFANLAYTKSRAEQIQFSDPYYIAKGDAGSPCGECRSAEIVLQGQTHQFDQRLYVRAVDPPG